MKTNTESRKSFIKPSVAFALGLGVGGILVAGRFSPVVGEIVRPVAKSALKASALGYRKMRESVAQFSESVEDLIAEVSAELSEEEPIAPEQKEAREEEKIVRAAAKTKKSEERILQ